MVEIPEFKTYEHSNPMIKERIQPTINWRNWDEIDKGEKTIILNELSNQGFIQKDSTPILITVDSLNECFMRRLPGKRLHSIQRHGLDGRQLLLRCQESAYDDFRDIILNESSDLVYVALSKFAKQLINDNRLTLLKSQKELERTQDDINAAFEKFDRFAAVLNNALRQFSVNVKLTRYGLIPRQDAHVINEIYVPTLQMLFDNKWDNVNSDLEQMFVNYSKKNYEETITTGHRVVHRFLQIILGEEGKNGRGELGRLFKEFTQDHRFAGNQFTKKIIALIQSYISSERASKSTAKPSVENTSEHEAMLFMNVVVIFLQYCLQSINHDVEC